MKKIFKQTGVALSIALLSSGFAMAQGTEAKVEEVQVQVSPTSVEIIETKVEDTPSAVITPKLEEKKVATKPIKRDKPRKIEQKEINMISKGNYIAPLNLSNSQIVAAELVNGLHVVPVVKLPENNSENYYEKSNFTIEFPFKNADGNLVSEDALISNNGKNLKIYHFSSDFSRLNVQDLNAFSDIYSNEYSRRECDVILYQYQMADDTEKAVEVIYLNKGKVSDKPATKGCNKKEVNKHETSIIDDNGYLINVTYKKPTAIEGKNQDLSVLVVKDGKELKLSSANLHILSNNYDFVKTVKGSNAGSQTSFYNLDLPADDYTFVLNYEVGGKTNNMVLQKSVRSK